MYKHEEVNEVCDWQPTAAGERVVPRECCIYSMKPKPLVGQTRSNTVPSTRACGTDPKFRESLELSTLSPASQT